MSDVSKTNELIAWADREYERINEIPWSARKCIERLANELDAATRVPVQGEPNDDREALAALIEEQEEYPHPRGYLGHADLILAAGFSRAAVPDAATEELAHAKRGRSYWSRRYQVMKTRAKEAEADRDDLADRLSLYLWDSTGGLLSKTGYDVRTMVAHTEEYYDKVHAEARKKAEAERDAALAALDRVRAEHPVGSTVLNNLICQTCGTPFPCPTIAALDGAPEPEVKR